jgi:hypothetical protein
MGYVEKFYIHVYKVASLLFVATLRHWNTPLALFETWGGTLDVTGWLLIAMAGRLVEDCWWRCCLKGCWECFLFTGARSMGCAVQWRPMKPEIWSVWFPLKSSPNCSYRWLHCDIQNVLREHPNCTARTQLANWTFLIEVTLRLMVGQSVSIALVSSTLVGLATRYYFLSECCCPKFAVIFLWGALSDERTGLQFAV